MSEWLLFNATYISHGEKKLFFNEMMTNDVRFVLDQHA